jgi:S1-C subfamily serine protease
MRESNINNDVNSVAGVGSERAGVNITYSDGIIRSVSDREAVTSRIKRKNARKTRVDRRFLLMLTIGALVLLSVPISFLLYESWLHSSQVQPQSTGIFPPTADPTLWTADRLSRVSQDDLGFSIVSPKMAKELTYAEVAKAAAKSTVAVYGSYDGNLVSSGTGVLMNRSGVIITAAHLLDKSNRIDIAFTNRSAYVAQLIAYDSVTDIALLQVDGEMVEKEAGIEPAEFGMPGNIGDPVLLYGNPVRRMLLMTDGILSGNAEAMFVNNYPMNVLMVNIEFKEGHANAPLFNTYGQVIGFAKPSLKVESGIGDETWDISIALPTTEVQGVVSDLLRKGKVSGRGWLSLAVTDIDRGYAAFIGVPQGALVSEKFINYRDISVGDIVIAVDGQDVLSAREMVNLANAKNVGDEVTLTIWASGEVKDVTITVVER